MPIGVLLLPAIVAAAIFADDPAKGLQRGAKVVLTAAAGDVPCFKNSADYKSFLNLAKNPSVASYQKIKLAYQKAVWTLESGTEGVVVEFAPEKGAGKIPSFDSLAAPGLIPPLVLKIGDREAPVWVPAIYARPAGSKPFAVEARLPVIYPATAYSDNPTVGEEYFLFTPGATDGVLATTDEFAFAEFVKAAKAKDDQGGKKLSDEGRAKLVPEGTKVRTLEVSRTPFSDERIMLAEVRFLEGELKDKSGFVLAQSLGRPTIDVSTSQIGRQRRLTPAEVKRATRLLGLSPFPLLH